MKIIKINFYQLLSKMNSKSEAPIYYKITSRGETPIKKSTGYFITCNPGMPSAIYLFTIA